MNEKFSVLSEGRRDRDSTASLSSSSSHEEHDVIQDLPRDSSLHRVQTEKSGIARASGDLRRTASNALAHVASRITTRTWPEPPPPPDGGVKAWTQVLMGAFAIATAWGYANSFGAFQSYYEEILPEPASTISWIGSIQVWLTLTVGAFSGRLLDAGFFLPTLIVGGVLQLLGIFLMSLSTKYWQLFLTQGVLSGIGAGIYFTPCISLVNTYFDKNRGLAVGLATAGNSGGGIIYPLLVRQLLSKIGFAWTTRVIGFLNLGLLAIVLAFMRPRLPPRKSGPLLDISAFKDPAYSGAVFGTFFALWSNYFVFYYIASFGIQTLGMSYKTASTLTIIVNGAGLPFRILTPIFADRYGFFNANYILLFAWAIVGFTWLAVHTIGGCYAWTIVYGILSASFQCLTTSTIAKITPRLDMIGTRLGMAFTISALSALTGPPIGGAILGRSGGIYRNTQIWQGLSLVVGLALMVFVRVRMGGWRLKVNV
ncbi:MFS general substrate transporter [Xylariaceae sp. FL1019]|nr:MFS general substrate transporter [Xylariaceae sp. FL1019]